ncbi:zf-HC2 domain-containing protein [Streptomyces jumonjinensis]|uniref:zf-HC2 domain-containing protein n=1 Tax=Streptomyces jumonjinensis TaxID=1945 RepID=UPI0037917EFA
MSGPLDESRDDEPHVPHGPPGTYDPYDPYDAHAGDGEAEAAPRVPVPRAAPDDLGPPPHQAPDGPGSPVDLRPPPPRPPAPDRPPTQQHAPLPPQRGTAPPEADMSATPGGGTETPSHDVLRSLLGAWALSACSAEETDAVEAHLGECAPCADEALRLRDAVALLHTERDLDLDPLLRFRVLENCLGRRPARIPVPEWASPYDAETARLDALLRDIGEAEWNRPVQLRWFEGGEPVHRATTVAGVIGHLLTVDGLVAGALGLDDPLGRDAPHAPTERTEKFWLAESRPVASEVHAPWRNQSHTLIRTVSFAGHGVADLSVSYSDFSLSLQDSLLDRAFECWMHADDIAEAVNYPYDPPRGSHLHRMVDLAARLLPAALAGRRRSGLAGPARHLVAAGSPGRSLHLEIEGAGGGDWYIPLDSPAALGSADHAVAQVALDRVEFCQLVAGHVSPEEAAAGQDGDRDAIRDVLFAAASLSRM